MCNCSHSKSFCHSLVSLKAHLAYWWSFSYNLVQFCNEVYELLNWQLLGVVEFNSPQQLQFSNSQDRLMNESTSRGGRSMVCGSVQESWRMIYQAALARHRNAGLRAPSPAPKPLDSRKTFFFEGSGGWACCWEGVEERADWTVCTGQRCKRITWNWAGRSKETLFGYQRNNNLETFEIIYRSAIGTVISD